MSQTDNLLRVLVPGDKEAKITAVPLTPTPSLFTSRLTLGYPRKAVHAYNNSHVNSGECYYGYIAGMTPTVSSRPIPVGAVVEIPVTVNIPLYFCSASGELGDMRVEEIA